MEQRAGRPPQPGGRQPAPGELALVQAFVNTTDLEEGWDILADPAGLRDWLAERGLVEPGATLGDADLAQALVVREAIRELLFANNGSGDGAAAAALLNRVAADALLVVSFDAGGQPRAVPAAGGLAGALARLFAIILAAHIDGTWTRLKACRNDICRWAFYDDLARTGRAIGRAAWRSVPRVGAR